MTFGKLQISQKIWVQNFQSDRIIDQSIYDFYIRTLNAQMMPTATRQIDVTTEYNTVQANYLGNAYTLSPGR